jgi:hypothetical protein
VRAARCSWRRVNRIPVRSASRTCSSDSASACGTFVALFAKIGPAVLLTHSASGPMEWVTATRADNVKAIVSYEPVGWLFPDNEVPAPVPTSSDPIVGTPIAPALFQKLTRIPIQIVFGDNIPMVQSPHPGLDAWRGRLVMARRFVEVVNAHGGHAELLSLPAIGVRGNTHFAFSDLNNVKIADLLSEYLHKERLDLPMKGQTPRHTPNRLW